MSSLYTNTITGTPAGKPLRESDPVYRALSPPLMQYNEGTIEVGIEAYTNDLYLLRCGPSSYDGNGKGTRSIQQIGKVSIHETAAGDGVILLAKDWIVRLTLLKDGSHLSEISFSFSRRLNHIAVLSPSTPFRREGHAEYDKLAVIFDRAPLL
jgi:hypothetical protein